MPSNQAVSRSKRSLCLPERGNISVPCQTAMLQLLTCCKPTLLDFDHAAEGATTLNHPHSVPSVGTESSYLTILE
jgi:hypothetical protein